MSERSTPPGPDRQYVIFEKGEGVARITFNRPEKRNALSHEMQNDIISCLEEARTDPSVNAVLTTGGECSAYCAGAELRNVARSPEGGPQAAATEKPPDIYELIRTFPKVTIAAVNGYCLGGGLALALCHDLIIASAEKAVFGLPEVKLNLVPGRPAAYLFKLIPQKWALDMALTGANWDARTALQRGIASRVVPHAELQRAAGELARSIAALDPVTMEYSKRAAHAIMEQPGFAGAIETGSAFFREHNKNNPAAGKGASRFLSDRKNAPESP
ncbi:MAG: enoyl-CoA hydratase/isomerase family protein [Chloroflexi bacterium]|nr:enoyl-CoA hydratase/isomerase family protein [Chloroflexota bacterium]